MLIRLNGSTVASIEVEFAAVQLQSFVLIRGTLLRNFQIPPGIEFALWHAHPAATGCCDSVKVFAVVTVYLVMVKSKTRGIISCLSYIPNNLKL